MNEHVKSMKAKEWLEQMIHLAKPETANQRSCCGRRTARTEPGENAWLLFKTQ